MSNILFKTVIFDKNLYSGAQVINANLIISAGQDYTVQFVTKEEAIVALKELHSLMEGNDTSTEENDFMAGTYTLDTLLGKLSSASNVVEKVRDELFNKVQEKVNTAKSTAQEKVMEAAFDNLFGKQSKTLKDTLKNLESAMNMLFPQEPVKEEPKQPVQPAPDRRKNGRSTTSTDTRKFNVESILDSVTAPIGSAGTKRTIEDILSYDKIIADMTTSELRHLIDDFIEELITSEKGAPMIEKIKTNFGDEAIEDALKTFKELVYTISTENAHMTFAQVVKQYFL